MVVTLKFFIIRADAGGVATLVVFIIVVDERRRGRAGWIFEKLERKGGAFEKLERKWNTFHLAFKVRQNTYGKPCLVNNCGHIEVLYYKGRRWRGGYIGRIYYSHYT